MAENVKELLEELKNLSQLMMDLAYSSVFFRNKEIAKEVMMLYERMEELEERLYLHLFAASRGKIMKKLISIIDIVESSKTVASAAKNLSELVLEGKELHPVIKHALEESDEMISKCIVSRRSQLSNKTIGEVRIRSTTGSDVVAIRRAGEREGKKWIFDPQKETMIYENDTLICIGPSASCNKLKKMASAGKFF